VNYKVVVANNSSVSLISLVVTPLWPPHTAFSRSYLALCSSAMTAGLDETVTTSIVKNERINTFTFSGAYKPGTKEFTFDQRADQRLSRSDAVVTDSLANCYLEIQALSRFSCLLKVVVVPHVGRQMSGNSIDEADDL